MKNRNELRTAQIVYIVIVTHMCTSLKTIFQVNLGYLHRHKFVSDGDDLSPPLLKVVMTVTSTFSKLQFFKQFVLLLLPEAFCGLKHADNAIAARAPPQAPLGSSQCSPRPPSRLGRGYPFPYSTPLGSFGASMLVPSAPRLSCPS